MPVRRLGYAYLYGWSVPEYEGKTWVAFDFDGQELWGRDIQADYGAFGILHGYSSSPAAAGLSSLTCFLREKSSVT